MYYLHNDSFSSFDPRFVIEPDQDDNISFLYLIKDRTDDTEVLPM